MDRWPSLRAVPQDHIPHPFAACHAFCSRDLIEELNLLLSQLEAYRCIPENSLPCVLCASLCWASKGIWSACSAVYRRIPAFHKCSVMCTFTVVYLHDLSGVECQILPVRSTFHSTTKLTAGSRLHRPHRRRGFHPAKSFFAGSSAHHCLGLYEHAKSTQPAWLAAS